MTHVDPLVWDRITSNCTDQASGLVVNAKQRLQLRKLIMQRVIVHILVPVAAHGAATLRPKFQRSEALVCVFKTAEVADGATLRKGCTLQQEGCDELNHKELNRILQLPLRSEMV